MSSQWRGCFKKKNLQDFFATAPLTGRGCSPSSPCLRRHWGFSWPGYPHGPRGAGSSLGPPASPDVPSAPTHLWHTAETPTGHTGQPPQVAASFRYIWENCSFIFKKTTSALTWPPAPHPAGLWLCPPRRPETAQHPPAAWQSPPVHFCPTRSRVLRGQTQRTRSKTPSRMFTSHKSEKVLREVRADHVGSS